MNKNTEELIRENAGMIAKEGKFKSVDGFYDYPDEAREALAKYGNKPNPLKVGCAEELGCNE